MRDRDWILNGDRAPGLQSPFFIIVVFGLRK